VLLCILPHDAQPIATFVESVNNRLALVGAGDDGLAFVVFAGFIFDGAAKAGCQGLDKEKNERQVRWVVV